MRAVPPPKRPASLSDKFATRRHESRDRLARIAAELDGADPHRRASLAVEAAEIAHFLAGCAAMFGEPALGELASSIEHQINLPSAQLPTSAAMARSLSMLIAALDSPPMPDRTTIAQRAAG